MDAKQGDLTHIMRAQAYVIAVGPQSQRTAVSILVTFWFHGTLQDFSLWTMRVRSFSVADENFQHRIIETFIGFFHTRKEGVTK